MAPGATGTEDRRSDSATRVERRHPTSGAVGFRPPTGAASAAAMSVGTMRGTPRPSGREDGVPEERLRRAVARRRARLATRGAHPGDARAPEAGLGRRREVIAGSAGGLGRGGERGRASARCGRSEWELGAWAGGGVDVEHPGRRRPKRDRRWRSARARRGAAAASAVARTARKGVAIASTATGAAIGSTRHRTAGEGGSSPEGSLGRRARRVGRGGRQGDGSRRNGHRGTPEQICDEGGGGIGSSGWSGSIRRPRGPSARAFWAASPPAFLSLGRAAQREAGYDLGDAESPLWPPEHHG